jgi:outer membrane protein assembly factor BamB
MPMAVSFGRNHAATGSTTFGLPTWMATASTKSSLVTTAARVCTFSRRMASHTGDVEVVTTSATGKVHVFDATGKSIATLDPGIYATMVRLFRVRGEKADSLLVIGGGPKDAKMVAINAKGQRLWQSDLPPDIKTCASLAVAPKSSWAAAGSMGSDVWVVDTVTGKIIGRHRSQGSPDVAWCAGDNEDPLLLVASTSGLTAWRVTPTVDSGDEE